MMSLTGNSDFSQIEMETIWTVFEACVIPTIIYSGESWDPTIKNFKEANQILEGLIKRTLKTPKNGTPREALYIETGLLDPEILIIRNRINMEARIQAGNNQTMKEIMKSTYKESWAKQNERLKTQLNISNEDMSKSK